MAVAVSTKKRYLSFSGGGAMGGFYIGAAEALLKSKNGEPSVMAGIERIGGASAGAITAAALATGITIEDFKKSSDFDFNELLDFAQSDYWGRGACEGNVLLNKVRTIIKNEILKRLEEARDKVKHDAAMSHSEKASLLKQLSRVRPNHITFQDFALLHKILPEKVKQLVISGTNITDNKVEYFSAATTPDMEVALAVRISAGFPLVFKQVSYKGKLYIDGGAKDNLPLDALHALNNKNGELNFLSDTEKREQTLAFILGKDNKAGIERIKANQSQSVFGYKDSVVSNLLNSVKRWFQRWATRGVTVDHHDNVTYHKVATRYSGQTVMLDTGDVSTLSFSKKPTQNQLRQTTKSVRGFVKSTKKQEFSDPVSCLLSLDYKEITDTLIDDVVSQSKLEDANKVRQVCQFVREEVKAKEKTNAQALIHEMQNLDRELKTNNTIPNEDLSNRLNLFVKKIERYAEPENNLGFKFDDGQKAIIYRRFQMAAKSIFPQFYQRLDTYNEKVLGFIKKNKLVDESKEAKDAANAYVQTTGFNFFKVATVIDEDKKQNIIASLHEVMHKPFQITSNVGILGQAITDIENSDDAHFIKSVLMNVKAKYQPRNILSLIGLVNSVHANTHTVVDRHVLALEHDINQQAAYLPRPTH